MSGLIFPFIGLIHECELIKTYAKDFLDKESINVLDEAKGTLESIRATKSSSLTKWQIPADRPLRTKWSDGESQRDNRSGYKLRAEFSFIWEIRRLDEANRKHGKHFLLDGLASTVTTLVSKKNDKTQVIARWTSDVGDAASPGTYCHFQVNRHDSEDPPFPKSLDIPRLPSPLMTPLLVVDLALGEIFQDRWEQHSLADTTESQRWRELHKDRVLRFLRWQAKCVEDFNGSPWMALKLAKPDRELLVKDA